MLDFDLQKLAYTTAWHNNCGLNCITHLLADKIATNEMQAINEQDPAYPAYQALLLTFQEYYQLSQCPNWDNIKTLFERYPSPIDREGIFAPVLRKLIGKILLNYQEELWETDASSALSDFLVTGNIQDTAQPVYDTNKEMFQGIKQQYDSISSNIQNLSVQPQTEAEIENAKAILKVNKHEFSGKNIVDQILLHRKNSLLDRALVKGKEIWQAQGCARYAAYIGDLSHNELISAHHLELICKTLHIGLKAYTDDSIENANIKNKAEADKPREQQEFVDGSQLRPDSYRYKWLLKTFNRDVHWIYEEENDQKRELHNSYYEGQRSNEFNIQSCPKGGYEEDIVEAVREHFGETKEQDSFVALIATIVGVGVSIASFVFNGASIFVSLPKMFLLHYGISMTLSVGFGLFAFSSIMVGYYAVDAIRELVPTLWNALKDLRKPTVEPDIENQIPVPASEPAPMGQPDMSQAPPTFTPGKDAQQQSSSLQSTPAITKEDAKLTDSNKLSV